MSQPPSNAREFLEHLKVTRRLFAAAELQRIRQDISGRAGIRKISRGKACAAACA
jgi:hypothetical protein